MNPNLTSALSDFTKKSEFSKSGLAAELSSEPPLHPSELSLITKARLRVGKHEGQCWADRPNAGMIDASHARALAWLDGPH